MRRGRSSGMIDVFCGLRSAISSGFATIRWPSESAKTSAPSGDCSSRIPVNSVPSVRATLHETNGRDLAARGDDRFDQPATVGRGCQGRQVGTRLTAPAVDLVAAIATRTLRVKEGPLPGRGVGRSRQSGHPVVDRRRLACRPPVSVATPAAFLRSMTSSAAGSSRLASRRRARFSAERLAPLGLLRASRRRTAGPSVARAGAVALVFRVLGQPAMASAHRLRGIGIRGDRGQHRERRAWRPRADCGSPRFAWPRRPNRGDARGGRPSARGGRDGASAGRVAGSSARCAESLRSTAM